MLIFTRQAIDKKLSDRQEKHGKEQTMKVKELITRLLDESMDAERMLTAPVTHGNQYTFYKAEREAKECHAT